MAWFSACRSPHQNPLLGGEDEFAGTAPTKGNDIPIPAMSRIHTLVLVLAPHQAKQVLKYTNDDLQKATKLAPESFRQSQQHQPLSKPWEKLFKVWFPDLYKEKSHIDCYHFLQWCEDHFDIAGTTDRNCTPFAASFLCKSINVW